jgi:putative ABC transport system permease protein
MWIGFSNLVRNDAHSFPYPFYRELRDRNTIFSGTLCYAGMSPALNMNGSSERVSGELVSGNYFEVLRVKPYVGRLFTREDERIPGGEHVAVLSYGFWSRRFGADPAVIGKVIHLNAIPMTVVGGSPPGFDGLDVGPPVEIRVPIMMQAEMWAVTSLLEGRNDWRMYQVARLKPGVTRMQAEAAVQPILISYLRTIREGQPTEYKRRLWASERAVLDPMARGEQRLAKNLDVPCTC